MKLGRHKLGCFKTISKQLDDILKGNSLVGDITQVISLLEIDVTLCLTLTLKDESLKQPVADTRFDRHLLCVCRRCKQQIHLFGTKK